MHPLFCSPQSTTVHPYFAFLIRCLTFFTLFPKYANTSFRLIALSCIVSLFRLYIRYAGHFTWQATSLYSQFLHGAFNINTHSLQSSHSITQLVGDNTTNVPNVSVKLISFVFPKFTFPTQHSKSFLSLNVFVLYIFVPQCITTNNLTIFIFPLP